MSSEGCEYSRREHSRAIPLPCSAVGGPGRGNVTAGDFSTRGANKAIETRNASGAPIGLYADVVVIAFISDLEAQWVRHGREEHARRGAGFGYYHCGERCSHRGHNRRRPNGTATVAFALGIGF